MNQEHEPGASDEAALWLTRMLGHDAGSFQAEFDAWIRADKAHAESYERLWQQYERSAVLAHSTRFPVARSQGHHGWFLPFGLGIGGIATGLAAAAVMLLSFSAAFTSFFQRSEQSAAPSAIASAGKTASAGYEFASPVGDIRSVILADGSKVTLDTGAKLAVAFDARTRFMRLAQGRARFEVRHETRPFIVAAGSGDITAHGTIFDVDIPEPGKVHVALLRGAIAVRIHDARSDASGTRELTVGQSVDFGNSGFEDAPQALSVPKRDWPSGVVDVDAMPLSELLREANRYTSDRIEVADPDLAILQVSGRFRLNRPDQLVQNLADLFGLSIDRSETGRIVLRRKIATGSKVA